MTTSRYPHLAARVFNTPLLIHPQKLDAIIAGLGSRLLGAPLDEVAAQAAAAAPTPGMFSTRRGEQADRGYRVVDGVAVLSINGALVHRSQFLAADSTFLLGYNDLAADLEDAMSSPDVHAVLQVYDTHAGAHQRQERGCAGGRADWRCGVAGCAEGWRRRGASDFYPTWRGCCCWHEVGKGGMGIAA